MQSTFQNYTLWRISHKSLTIYHEESCASQRGILLKSVHLFYTLLHTRLSLGFYSYQLSDVFAYQSTGTNLLDLSSARKSADTVVVYNLNNLIRSSQRLLIFVSSTVSNSVGSSIKSITNLYPNAHWLEREVLEMFNYKFALKRDTRNLLLQYGDSSAPFLKSFPTVGVRELFYNPMRDSVDQRSTSLQN